MGLTECYCFDGKEEEKLTSFNDEIMAERSVLPVEEFTFTYKGLEASLTVNKCLQIAVGIKSSESRVLS